MLHKVSAADRHIRDPECAHHAASFDVEMPSAAELGVITHFGNYVRSGVGSSGVVGCVKLNTQGGIERKGEDNFAGAHKLLRVLNAEAPCEFISRMPDRAELTGAGVGH